ncbi:MAG: hypothetical protein JNK64_16715 [Myxococcales bacterium]|nr:hypothetical protein [Myxococcales bacterium]
MTHLPASVLALATTLSLAAGVAEAKPHRARPRPPAARPLLRATPAPAAAVSQPRVSASERPVCGNIATKGPMRRECKDSLGVTYQIEADAGHWKTLGRYCTLGAVQVSLDATGRATVAYDQGTRRARTVEVAANATSTEPLVAACRRGLP